MIFRSAILPSVLLALAAARKHSETTVDEQRNLRVTKSKPITATDTSDAENIRNEGFKGIWRLLQTDMSMPLEVPSPSPTESVLEIEPTSSTPSPLVPSPVSVPTKSPVVVQTEAPVSVQTISPMMTTISDFPSLVPSQSSTFDDTVEDATSGPTLLETGIPSASFPEGGSDIPSDLPSTSN